MATEAGDEQDLYQKRVPIFPRSVKGTFRNLKYGILFLAYGVYFLLPWLRWARETGPQQALLFDIDGRRFYVFDLVVYAQDIFWLAGFLIIAAWLLFFVTGLAGRVFCGYFCFQTLWTDVYMLIERLVQGERRAPRAYPSVQIGLERREVFQAGADPPIVDPGGLCHRSQLHPLLGRCPAIGGGFLHRQGTVSRLCHHPVSDHEHLCDGRSGA